MNRLQINFAPVNQRRPLLRIGLSSVVLMLALSTVWVLSNNSEAGLPAAQRWAPAEEEIAAINVATSDLNFPWLNALSIVESSINSSLRLSQLELDSREGLLTLNGEGRDGKAILELPGRLRVHPEVADARVQSQNPVPNSESNEFLIRFIVEVSFRE